MARTRPLYKVKTNRGNVFYFKKKNFRTKVGAKWGGEAGQAGIKTKSVTKVKKPKWHQKLSAW